MPSDEVVDLARGPTVRRPLEPLPGPLGHCEGDYMPEALSFTEIDRQHLEMLPARTVMSMFMTTEGAAGGTDSATTGDTGTGTDPFSKVLGILGPVTKLIPSK